MIRSVIACALVFVSCGRSTKNTEAATDNLAWDPTSEDPSRLFSGADARLLYNVDPTAVGATFGVQDDMVPYPDTYWPFVQDGIDANWTGTQSPLEKYMRAADPSRAASAKAWEKNNHGSAVPGVADWWGHCPGWTAASMVSAPIRHAVHVGFDGANFYACVPDSPGCTKFEIGDINALMAEVHLDAGSGFMGARCDTKPGDIPRDQNGRIMQQGCRGLNAGSLVVILGNVMRGQQKPIALDAQNDANTDQIWNQPAYRFTLYRFVPVTEVQATAIVRGTTGGSSDYEWNEHAQGWVFVDIGIWWVSERGPNRTAVSGLSSSKEMRVTAILEVDGDPTQLSTRIIGGEYINDPSAGSTRLKVPPFVWRASGPGPEDLSTDVGGNNHNPYLKPSLVLQLAALGAE